jgi:hypothetical protein
MATKAFKFREGDTNVEMIVTLKGRDKKPADLTGCTVQMVLRRRHENTTIADVAVEVLDQTTLKGKIKYLDFPDLVLTHGFYRACFNVTYPDTSTQSFPYGIWD